MLALIDSDSLLYRVGFASEDDEEWIAKARLDETLTALVDDELNECKDHKFYISGSENFRFGIAKTHPYKGNREKLKRPKHLQVLRDHIVNKWNAEISEGMEADDVVSIMSYKHPKSIIAHIDKDLDQIPGSHYNYVKKLFYNVGKTEALRKLYTQALVGDTADNIKGVRGIGPKKAEKLLKECFTEKDLYNTVLSVYNNSMTNGEERLHENMNLLYLLRSEDDHWRAPE
jgi:DNA polymerase I